jgi:hypothetical protein
MFTTFDRLLSFVLVMGVIRGHDHHRDPCPGDLWRAIQSLLPTGHPLRRPTLPRFDDRAGLARVNGTWMRWPVTGEG